MNRTIAALAVVAVSSISTGLISVGWAAQSIDAQCVSFPLPTSPIGPSWTTNINSAPISSASFDIIVWRQACTGDASKSVLLARLIPTGGAPHPKIVYATQTNILYDPIFRFNNTGDNITDYGDPFTPLTVSTTALIQQVNDVRFEANYQVFITFGDNFSRATSLLPLNVPAAANVSSTTFPQAATSYYTNYSGNWWNSSENGSGFSILQGASNQLFVIWYTYTQAGDPVWLVASGGTWSTDGQTFTGTVYQPKGTWYGKPWDPSQFHGGNPVGTFTVTFATSNSATFNYSVNGSTGTKAITRLIY
jgi:hypothetical protein